MSREHEMDSFMERTIINADDDDNNDDGGNDDPSESTVSWNSLILLLNSQLTMLLGSLSYIYIVGGNAVYNKFRGSVKGNG